MCTLSWLPGRTGFRILINRDERRTRARGLAPRISSVAGMPVLAPTDGDFGGTWVGVNRAGLVVAILNRYQDMPPAPPPGMISRGLLVRDLLGAARSTAGFRRALAGTDLGRFQPFTIVAIATGGRATIADWTGRKLLLSNQREGGVIRTSSGHDQPLADRARRDALERIRAGRPLTAALLLRLHRSHLPKRGPLSACMHRPEAKTQSLTEIVVTRTTAAMRYAAGSPCRARFSRRLTLGLARR